VLAGVIGQVVVEVTIGRRTQSLGRARPVDERQSLGHAAGQLQFELQFTLLQRDSRTFSGAPDLRRCMSVDVRARRAADS
jgi:hypothetical protein